MKVSELRQKTEKELKRQLINDKEKLQALRFDMVAGKVKNVRAIRTTRKEIATIMTVLGEKKYMNHA